VNKAWRLIFILIGFSSAVVFLGGCANLETPSEQGSLGRGPAGVSPLSETTASSSSAAQVDPEKIVVDVVLTRQKGRRQSQMAKDIFLGSEFKVMPSNSRDLEIAESGYPEISSRDLILSKAKLNLKPFGYDEFAKDLLYLRAQSLKLDLLVKVYPKIGRSALSRFQDLVLKATEAQAARKTSSASGAEAIAATNMKAKKRGGPIGLTSEGVLSGNASVNQGDERADGFIGDRVLNVRSSQFTENPVQLTAPPGEIL
jgi:hypothetical protein